MQQGDLVLTEDGYYGIVVGSRDVFLGNGCQEIFDDEGWAKLRPLPINVAHESGGANFAELLRAEQLRQQIKDIGAAQLSRGAG